MLKSLLVSVGVVLSTAGVALADDPVAPIGTGGGIVQPVEETTLHCSSSRYRYAECTLPGPIAIVKVVRQASQAACVEGRSYGFRHNILWVKAGCRADFQVFHTSPVDPTPIAPNACRAMSDTYGIAANVTWGSAPAEVQQLWSAASCNFPESCQVVSDTFGTNHGVTWGTASPAIQTWWSRNACRTRPQL